jgi:hypothetical protein
VPITFFALLITVIGLYIKTVLNCLYSIVVDGIVCWLSDCLCCGDEGLLRACRGLIAL